MSWIGPDPELDAFKFLPEGIVPEMVLINYDQQHYNLIISQDSSLAKVGTLSEHLEESIDEEVLEEDEEEMGMEVDDQVTIAEKFASLEKEYRKSQNVIKMLNKKVSFLEKKLMSNNSKDDSVTVINDLDDIDSLDETEILKNKTNVYRRVGPHVQPKPSNPGLLVFQCKECKVMLETNEQAVPKCRENQLGKCVYSGIECWYRHEEMSFVYDFDKGSKTSVFQMAPENNLPPEMMLRIMTMMEKLILKVDKLEKASQNLN